MLSTTLWWAPTLNAETETDKAAENLKLTQKESIREFAAEKYAVTTSYRGGVKILEKVTPPDESKLTVYYVYLNGFKVLTYKTGQMGSEFSGAGMGRRQIKPEYTIKMAGDKEGRIEWITLYSADFTKTYDRFSLKDGELIPWSSDKLANWRKMRSEAPHKAE